MINRFSSRLSILKISSGQKHKTNIFKHVILNFILFFMESKKGESAVLDFNIEDEISDLQKKISKLEQSRNGVSKPHDKTIFDAAIFRLKTKIEELKRKLGNSL